MWIAAFFGNTEGGFMHFESAAENMTKSLVTITFDQPIEEAYAMMQQWGVRHLPVRDNEGKIVGILADSDIYRAMNPARPGFGEGLTVGDYMSWPAITIDESMGVSDVAEAMITEKVGAFLVTKDGGEPTGIVTTEDLLRVLQRVLDETAGENAKAETGGERGASLSALPYSPVVREAMRELQSVGL
jgi:CBS domain-containing protein